MQRVDLDHASDYELRSIALDKRYHVAQQAYAAALILVRNARAYGRIDSTDWIETILESQYNRMPTEVRWEVKP